MIHAFDGPGSTLAKRLASLDSANQNSNIKYFPCDYAKFKDQSDNIKIGGFENKHTHAGKNVVFCMLQTDNDSIMMSMHAIVVLLESFIGSCTVVCPFVPSATMERVVKEGEVATANTLCRILSGLPSCGAPVRYLLYDLHTLQQRFFFHPPAVADLNTVVDVVCKTLHHKFDWAFFPDSGAFKRFGKVLEDADLWGSNIGTCDKVRKGDDRKITVLGDHDLTGKKVLLIDDLVRTGNTLLQSARALRELGAAEVSAFCVHAAGSVEDLQTLARDPALNAFYTTDSVEPTVARLLESDQSPRDFFYVASIASLVYADVLRIARPQTLDMVVVNPTPSGASGQKSKEKLSVVVCSTCSIKVQAVRNALATFNPDADVHGVACESKVSEQPMTWQETVTGCKNRLEHGMRLSMVDMWVAIENGIDERSGDDFAYIGVADRNNTAYASSTSVHVPVHAIAGCSGSGKTYSQVLFQEEAQIKDPHFQLCKVNRGEILELAVRVALGQLLALH